MYMRRTCSTKSKSFQCPSGLTLHLPSPTHVRMNCPFSAVLLADLDLSRFRQQALYKMWNGLDVNRCPPARCPLDTGKGREDKREEVSASELLLVTGVTSSR
uniref:Uncharacterized protein n=1 Tax=Micrurus spixii TaxID=129469 RepID=A0A2D4M420_9SAUR